MTDSKNVITHNMIASGGIRVLDQGVNFFSRVPNFFLYGVPLWGTSIGHLLPPLLGQQEERLWGASAVRGALSNTSAAKQVRMSDLSCELSVAVQLLARHLEVNC